MSSDIDQRESFLQTVYSALDLRAGSLLTVSDAPRDLPTDEWIAKGGWLTSGKKAGAEKIFFVDQNPVVVFATAPEGQDHWKRLFNQMWCMARPPLLFVSQPGELNVLDLNQPPVGPKEAFHDQPGRILDTVRKVAEVQTKLKKYHRAELESGRFFAEHHFALENRADRSLIRDLDEVRKALLVTGLSVRDAHALIGRSIFVRYLEDRGILTEEYFRQVAAENRHWHEFLDAAPRGDDAGHQDRLFYTSVLQDQGFANSLFARLSRDFNGDLFPFHTAQQTEFTLDRLQLVRSFLLGEIEQKRLFFFAYDFRIIPLELISSMYEKFLKDEKGKQNTLGSFYTPPVLVEFVLSQTLAPQVLDKRPRIMDAACGSGIFLVEAFHRIVRHRMRECGRRLRPTELKKILREQISGIDINPEAIRVAAFSLYLAVLSYFEPPDILHHRLPFLTYHNAPETIDKGLEAVEQPERLDILLPANAFNVAAAVDDVRVRQRFSSACADVVVGNPPWGQSGQHDESAEQAYRDVLAWRRDNGREIGDQELSQAFIHRSLDMLRNGGVCGLLVSTGVFFKRHTKSRLFREQWLTHAHLCQVVNFAAVRQAFFSAPERDQGAIAPFASVVFTKCDAIDPTHRFQYYSAKETSFVEGLQAVVLARSDLHMLHQQRVLRDDELWKVYWWGGHRDEALIQALRAEVQLHKLVDPTGKHPERMGEGFKKNRKDRKPTTHLQKYRELPTNCFTSYGPFPVEKLKSPPANVERERDEALFDGLRLLIKRGLTQRSGANGKIVARLESTPFCFRHSIHCFRLPDVDEDSAKLVLGIVWSSLARYFLWMTAGSWGMWHHELRIDTLKKLPIRLAAGESLKTRLTAIVDELRASQPLPRGLLARCDNEISSTAVLELEARLDEAVFDLFELSEAERDLVRDMCDVGLDLFYRGIKSHAAKPLPGDAPNRTFGRRSDLQSRRGLEGYLDAFLEIWEPQLAPGGRFFWRLIRPPQHAAMLAVVFATENKDQPLPPPNDLDDAAWSQVLASLSESSRREFGSPRIFIDGLTRIVRPHDITIIKRNELRLWTRSAAREDAEATLLQAIAVQDARKRHA